MRDIILVALLFGVIGYLAGFLVGWQRGTDWWDQQNQADSKSGSKTSRDSKTSREREGSNHER
jgi:hypothetical protein